MKSLKDKLINPVFWIKLALMVIASLSISIYSLLIIDFDDKVISSYDSLPYHYCLVSYEEKDSNNEFYYFDRKVIIFRNKNGEGFSGSYTNTDVFMQEASSKDFLLSGLLEGEAELGSQEIGITKTLASKYGFSIGSSLFIPKLTDTEFKIKAIYEDVYGIFSLDYHSEFGYFILGKNEEMLGKNEYRFARFVEDYPTGVMGPVAYPIENNELKVKAERKNTIIALTLEVTLLLLFISELMSFSERYFSLPHSRLYGYRNKALFASVAWEDLIEFAVVFLISLTAFWCLEIGLHPMLIYSLILASVLLEDLISYSAFLLIKGK